MIVFVPPRKQATPTMMVIALAAIIAFMLYVGLTHNHAKRPNVPPVHKIE